MIKFALKCERGHGFESWFRDNASFEEQAKRGFVECPQCGSIRTEKAIMAPNIARMDRESVATAQSALAVVAPAAMPATTLTPEDRAMRDLVRAMRAHVEANADNVGDKFADEALKMHHGELEGRQIYGSATPDDARMLAEEGVGFMPLPMLPDDRN
ncbi:MAG: DUF1178 family protein [Bosea sp. (in: a-proteobacteria)]